MDDELLREVRPYVAAHCVRAMMEQNDNAAATAILARIDARLASGGWIKASESELAAARRETAEKVREALLSWSRIRLLLSQGADIHTDYQGGKYKGYEEYSARLDEAAREREAEFSTIDLSPFIEGK